MLPGIVESAASGLKFSVWGKRLQALVSSLPVSG